MNKKQQAQVPVFLIVIIVALVAVIAFIFIVHKPFLEKKPKYEADHASAVSQISLYNDYLSRASEVSSSIVSMKAEYEERSMKLFVNADKTPDDIRTMVNKLDITLDTIAFNPGVEDSEGRTTVAGYPLYYSDVAITFKGTESLLLSTLDYLEVESDGSYYVNAITMSKDDETETETSGNTVPVKSGDPRFTFNINVRLYYFNTKVEVSLPESVESSEESAA